MITTKKPRVSKAPGFEYKRPQRSVNMLIWHCTATPEGRPVSVAEIDRWHRDRDFAEIGYHFVVHLDGRIERGRDLEKVGAHVQGHNVGTIGAVYVGGTERDGDAKDTRTAAQKKAMLALTVAITNDPRIVRIAGHNEFDNKACPSFDVRKDALGNIPGFRKGKRKTR